MGCGALLGRIRLLGGRHGTALGAAAAGWLQVALRGAPHGARV